MFVSRETNTVGFVSRLNTYWMVKKESENRLDYLKNIVQNMPELPGSYQFWNKEKEIIYVGKAKNLRRRVASYFHKEVDRFKTKVLVGKISDITYTVVKTEEDALHLENALIKRYQPRYNVLLKDGKTYPSICVTNETFPRIFHTRTINKRTGTYFGPYSHIGAMYAILELIKKVHKPRTCRFPITEEGIKQGKYKQCLEFHIGNCDAPCVGKQSKEDYCERINQAKEILRGNTRDVLRNIFDEMGKKAEELRFEEAEQLKQKYLLVNNFCSKSVIVSHTINNVDVFSITNDKASKKAFINYLHVTNGTVNQSFTFEYKRKLDESDEELLILAITEIRERFGSNAREVIIPFKLEWQMENILFTVPIRGDKRHLLELSEMNGKQYRFDRLKQAEKLNPEQRQTRLMKELQNALGLERLPLHIECFDNSNISGSNAVAGCIVFRSLKPSKKEYRKYNIKTVVGPDDYASMKEVVFRRYRRMKDEGTPLPDLIITDGGRGQIEVVRQVVEDELGLQIPIAGLAKNSRHRTNELLFGFPAQVVGMKTDSELFSILTRIQDEVHRYAITFHRDKRSKKALHSELDDIKGVGPATKDALIKSLKSVKQIKKSDIQTLTNIIGASKAQLIYNYFHQEKKLSENYS